MRFSSAVQLMHLRSGGASDEERTPVQPESLTAHRTKPAHDLGLREHLPERLAVRLRKHQEKGDGMVGPDKLPIEPSRLRVLAEEIRRFVRSVLQTVAEVVQGFVRLGDFAGGQHVWDHEMAHEVPVVSFACCHGFFTSTWQRYKATLAQRALLTSSSPA